MKNVTIYDIAKALNVNPSTVNRALSGKKGVGDALRARIADYADQAGYHINPAAKSLNRQLKIGIVMQHTVSAFESQLIGGIEEAYAELSAMNVVLERHYTQTREEYEQSCATLKDTGCDAVLLLSVRTGSLGELCRELSEANMAVGAVVSDVSPAQRLFSVHLDGETTGGMAAELLFRFTRGERVAVFTGDPAIPIHAEILRGFNRFVQEKFDIAAVYADDADPDKARYNAKTMLADYPDVGGIFISTANSVPICEEIVRSGRPIEVIAMDVFEETANYLRSGVISALLYQQPRYQGYIALWNMVKVLDGYMAPQDVIIQPQVVMRSNIDAYQT